MRLKAIGRNHTVETIAKMVGRTHSETTKNKIKNILQTEEVRYKMLEAALKRKGIKLP